MTRIPEGGEAAACAVCIADAIRAAAKEGKP